VIGGNWKKLGSGVLVPSATASAPAYDSASQGRRLRAWRTPNSGPNTSLVYEMPVIRSRTRAAARNDPWMGAALDKSDANGIGTGITCKMINGSDELKAAVKRLWNRWTKQSDADGMLDWHGQQYLAWHEWREVGEVFARRRMRRLSDGLAVPIQIQLIESEQVPTDLNTIASNGNEVRCGIEFDRIGRRVAYWMYRSHPGDQVTMATNASELVRVPASEVLHLYRPVRAGQIRGIPETASVLIKAFNLDNLDDAVLERQKLANLFAGFYTKTIDPESPESIVDEMTDGEAETDEDDVPLAGLEPGTMQELPPGWQAQLTQPPAPGTDYAEFLRGHLLAIAARHGVPYEVLTGDLRNVSDRALKLILNEFRRLLEMLQWLFFIPRLLQPAREWWFDAAFLAGALPISDEEYEEQRDEIVETLWVPQGWPYSHPVQDVQADRLAIRAGLTSRTQKILETGEDPEQVDQEIAEDNARADRLGLVLDSDPRKVSSAGLTQARPPGSVLPEASPGQEDNSDE